MSSRFSPRTASAAEQTVGFPSGGRRGFLPGHGSAVSGAAQNVDLLAGGGLQDFSSGHVSTAFPGAEHGHDAHGHGALHGSRRLSRDRVQQLGCARGGLLRVGAVP